MAGSIIRDGNHFIHLEDAGWVLIDGPWFEMLSSPGQQLIEVPIYKPLDFGYFSDSSEIPKDFEFESMFWEAVRWNPGCALFKDAKRARAFDNRNLDLWYKWYDVLKKRTKIGWRVLPDGKLPVLFNAMEWHDEMMWGALFIAMG